MTKCRKFYLILCATWAILVSFAVMHFALHFQSAIFAEKGFIVCLLIVINALFVLYFWLNGIKDIVYIFFYYLFQHKVIELNQEIAKVRIPFEKGNPRVVLLYCTADDFIGDSLYQSMQQDYDNFKVVILDDSKKTSYKIKIDAFAQEHKIEVIRRADRKGFKAGNLNNYLQDKVDYDYFVILDSDEIIPENYITGALKFFVFFNNIGIVQASHLSTRNENRFMDMYAGSVDTHWPAYQSAKHRYGFSSLLGHGAMISKECYQATKGFPELVSEDLCFSIEARLKGYYVAFANQIICQEQHPVNYYAFRKRHSRWTQGNMEFIRKYTKKILFSEMNWYEKLDIILFTYNLPLTACFSLYLVMNVILFPLLNYHPGYAPWMVVPTAIFILAPMLNDIMFQNISIWYKIRLSIHSLLLYGSLFWTSLFSSMKSMLGVKAKFIVTPKENQEFSFSESILLSLPEILYGLVLSVTSLLFTKSLFPVILIVIPSFFTFYLMRMHQRKKHQTPPRMPLRAKTRSANENTGEREKVAPSL